MLLLVLQMKNPETCNGLGEAEESVLMVELCNLLCEGCSQLKISVLSL